MNSLCKKTVNEVKYAQCIRLAGPMHHFPHHCHERTSGMCNTDSIEIWRPIVGHLGYEISDFGRVRSLDRVIKGCFYRGVVLKPTRSVGGYMVVKTTARKLLLVHRLVALAFLDRDDLRNQVNHLNGNRQDNRLQNLEWVTNAENNKHAFDFLGRTPSCLGKFGDDHHRSIAVVSINPKTGERTRYGSARMAESDGFIGQSIAKCCKGQMNRHHGMVWEYEK